MLHIIKRTLSIIFVIFISISTFSQTNDDMDTLWLYGKSTDKTYGKKIENPIKIGFGRLPLHINRYLNNLADENGNHVKFMRVATEDVPGKSTPISVYAIETEDDKYDTLYFDNFAWETPKLVAGYLWKERREEYYGEYANDTDTVGTGKGIYFYPDGSAYKGMWKNGKREGLGRLYYPENSDIEYMEGYFVDDKQKGKFKVVKKDGSISSRDF